VKVKFVLPSVFLASAMVLSLAAGASSGVNTPGKDAPKDTGANSASAAPAAQDETNRLEGEKRFRSNCARCHAAPPKFPPRMMATIVRHMRVRAAITEQDMHLILRYMTE
jgi:mono/diheme cytochrome c family protein